MNKKITIKVGARNSKLAIVQTNKALDKIVELLPSVEFDKQWLTTTGDRDQQTDLKVSAANFFTDDLDTKVINEELDCAVHSAKDLPDVINPEIDWFWLPWREDPRDVLVLNKNFEIVDGNILREENDTFCNHPGLKIGISSERREQYCAERFPDAELLSIRGNIDGRIEQLDQGKYDVLIMAAAGLKRLDFTDRIDEYIPLKDMTPPQGQGYLAVTFKKGNPVLSEIRKLFVKETVFAGSGPGNETYAPVATVEALKKCEICLYDALSPKELLRHLPENAQAVYVGKRSGLHSKNQKEICALIEEYVKQGKSVVRLKGGDPGIFGRLAEEIAVMDEYGFPFTVIPAATSLSAATTGTGLLLTRRGVSRGFTALTPRRAESSEYHELYTKERNKMPFVFFMAITKVKEIVEGLMSEGFSPSTPCSIVLSAGAPDQRIISSDLANISPLAKDMHPKHGPGLLIVGEIASGKYIYKNHGLYSGQKILVTGSESIQEKSAEIIRQNGGESISLPLIQLVQNIDCIPVLQTLSEFDWVVLTSPASAKIFLQIVEDNKMDMRSIPKVLTCGPGTSEPFIEKGIFPDAEASNKFGVEGILKTASEVLKKDDKVLRLASDIAGTSLAESIAEFGPEVTNLVLYKNVPVTHEICPDFTTVFFASASAARSFKEQFGEECLENKTVIAIGQPTAKELTGTNYTEKVIATVATVPGCFNAFSAHIVNEYIKQL